MFYQMYFAVGLSEMYVEVDVKEDLYFDAIRHGNLMIYVVALVFSAVSLNLLRYLD